MFSRANRQIPPHDDQLQILILSWMDAAASSRTPAAASVPKTSTPTHKTPIHPSVRTPFTKKGFSQTYFPQPRRKVRESSTAFRLCVIQIDRSFVIPSAAEEFAFCVRTSISHRMPRGSRTRFPHAGQQKILEFISVNNAI
jgi:hypothetical protein